LQSKKLNLKARIQCYNTDSFAKIMQLCGVTPAEVMRSLDTELNRNSIFKSGQGSGRSGSFFFFSADKKLIIKSMRGSEKRTLLGMLDSLVMHFEANKDSLINKVFGVFRVQTKFYASMDFIVLQNVSRDINPSSMKLTFDLKGSTVHREVKVSS
jgi:1-phosphatidylinositol-4-phosphate 5-kinase